MEVSLDYIKMSMKKRSSSSKSSLVPISSVLQNSQKKTQSAFAISKLRKEWKGIVGELLYSQTRPKKTDRNILWISVENSGLHYELSLMKPSLIDKIQEITNTRFKDLKFINEEITKQDQTPIHSTGKKFERTPASADENLQEILERVKALSIDLQKKR